MTLKLIDSNFGDKYKPRMTAAESNAVKYMMEHGMDSGGTNTKRYRIKDNGDETYTVNVSGKYVNTIGGESKWNDEGWVKFKVVKSITDPPHIKRTQQQIEYQKQKIKKTESFLSKLLEVGDARIDAWKKILHDEKVNLKWLQDGLKEDMAQKSITAPFLRAVYKELRRMVSKANNKVNAQPLTGNPEELKNKILSIYDDYIYISFIDPKTGKEKYLVNKYSPEYLKSKTPEYIFNLAVS